MDGSGKKKVFSFFYVVGKQSSRIVFFLDYIVVIYACKFSSGDLVKR